MFNGDSWARWGFSFGRLSENRGEFSSGERDFVFGGLVDLRLCVWVLIG